VNIHGEKIEVRLKTITAGNQTFKFTQTDETTLSLSELQFAAKSAAANAGASEPPHFISHEAVRVKTYKVGGDVQGLK
jgi:hypothetical protein